MIFSLLSACDSLCQGLTRQLLWVILCRPPDKKGWRGGGGGEIEEIVEEMRR